VAEELLRAEGFTDIRFNGFAHMQTMVNRRRLLAMLPSAGALGLLGSADASAQAAPPETTRLRLTKSPSICWAPQYISEQRAEGFTDISFFELLAGDVPARLSAGEADISMNFVGPNIISVDVGDPIVFLGGVHVGWELKG
jgi:NitT/TauT family transport system substrate-binding protein